MTEHSAPAPLFKRQAKALNDGPPAPSAGPLGDSILWLTGSAIAALLGFALAFFVDTPSLLLIVLFTLSVMSALFGARDLSSGVRRYAARADDAALRTWIANNPE